MPSGPELPVTGCQRAGCSVVIGGPPGSPQTRDPGQPPDPV